MAKKEQKINVEINIEMIKVKDLIDYENNPRFNDEAAKVVANSIREFGFRVSIVIDKDNVIVCGHTRKKAAILLGLDVVPCTRAEDLTPKQIKAFRLADNKTGELAEWDDEKLQAEIDEIMKSVEDIDDLEIEIDMSDFGFDLSEFGIEDEEEEIIEDEAPQVDEASEPITKLGDIWKLGNHRLMCGDSTDKATVEKLMNGKKADLVFTDPPYGIDIVKTDKIGGDKPFGSQQGKVGFGEKGKNKILNCNTYIPIKGDETTETARLNYEIIKDISKNQIIFGGNYFTDFLPPKACWCIWDKENTGNFADVEMAWTSFDKGAKLYRWLWNGLCRKGERAIEGKTRVHPTQKPVGLIAEILKDFTKEKDIILDCFGGSGSTLIACEQIERQCYMIEYEPRYCDVIIKRWETLTGKKAKRANGKSKSNL